MDEKERKEKLLTTEEFLTTIDPHLEFTSPSIWVNCESDRRWREVPLPPGIKSSFTTESCAIPSEELLGGVTVIRVGKESRSRFFLSHNIRSFRYTEVQWVIGALTLSPPHQFQVQIRVWSLTEGVKKVPIHDVKERIYYQNPDKIYLTSEDPESPS